MLYISIGLHFAQFIDIFDRNMMKLTPTTFVLVFTLVCSAAAFGGENKSELSFSNAENPLQYHAVDIFDPRGMEHLYTLTTWFLEVILKDSIPEEFITEDIIREPLQVVKRNENVILSHFMNPLIVAIFGICLAVIIPLSGLIFCCCRCAGRCGGRRGVIEKHKDPCKRAFCSFFFFPVIIALLFGLVCAFVTNEYVEQGVRSLPDALETNSKDVNTFLVNTRSEVNTLLIKNFQQLQKRLDNTLDQSGVTVKTRLGEVSKAVAVDNLTVIVFRLEGIQEHLRSVVNFTRQIQQSTSQLQQGLKVLQNDLVRTLRECRHRQCREELDKQNFRALSVVIDTNKLPDLDSVVRNVSALLSNNIKEEITKGKMAFDKLSNTIQVAVNKTVPDIKTKIARVGDELVRMSTNISDALYFPQFLESKRHIDHIEPYFEAYSRYRWYICLFCCCIMLLIVLCFSFGLLCGACSSERSKNVYNVDSGCSRSKGAKFLLCGVAIVFLFSFCLLIVTTALFLVGGVTERIVCSSFADVNNTQIRKIINLAEAMSSRESQSTVTEEQVDYQHVLRECQQNATLYKAFGLDSHTQVQLWPTQVLQIGNFSDIRSYKQRYQVDQKLQDFLHQISINPTVTLLTPEGIDLLERLRDTPISDINFDIYFKLDENGLTGVNLMDVSHEITEKANLLPASDSTVANHLRNIALQLESYETKLVKTILTAIADLKAVVQMLKNEAEFGGKDLQKAIAQLLDQAKWAQDFISTKGRDELRKLATTFVEEFTMLMDKYADHVQYKVEHVVGKCGPVGKAYNATLVAVCDEIVQPFNGYWASLGFCSLISLPGLFIAVILSVLYRRVDPYPTPLVDADCASDSYTDRDNIPLAHGHRKPGRNELGSYENRNGYIHDYSPGCQEMIPLSRSSRDFSLSPESPSYPLFAPSSITASAPTAPENEDWANTIILPEYSKPPPYHYPNP